jgi:hypothetical protein
LNGFPTRIEHTGVGARAALKDTHFATLIVIADLNDSICIHWLDDLRRAALRSWMIVSARGVMQILVSSFTATAGMHALLHRYQSTT